MTTSRLFLKFIKTVQIKKGGCETRKCKEDDFPSPA
jgi:hypothetical protein